MTAPATVAADKPPAVCASYIGARRMRVTRLDACGRPDTKNARGWAVSSGFVSVEIGTEVEEGEDYTQKTAGGDLCVSDKGQDNIKWLTVSIEFCQVDPDIFQLLNPTWKLVQNAAGQATGFRIGQKMSDQYGFALELWPKVSGGGAGCDDEGGNEDPNWPSEPSGYFLLPWTLGTAPDSWTLENGTATFTLQGRTKAGSRWGKGPWAVTRDEQGNPSPLLIPIENGLGSSGVPSIDGSYDPDHFHADQVTIPPPPAACGAKKLVLPQATPTVTDLGVSLAITNFDDIKDPDGNKPVRVVWGDGNKSDITASPATHTYATAGTYPVTVIAPLTGAVWTQNVTVPPAPPAEDPSQAASADEPARRSMSLALDDAPDGDVLVDWGDGTQDTVTGPGPHPHTYAADGDYEIRALDETGAEVTTQQVSVPFSTADPNDGK